MPTRESLAPPPVARTGRSGHLETVMNVLAEPHTPEFATRVVTNAVSFVEVARRLAALRVRHPHLSGAAELGPAVADALRLLQSRGVEVGALEPRLSLA